MRLVWMSVLQSNFFKIFSVVFVFLTFSSFALETTADEISIDSEQGIYTLTGNAVAKEDEKTFKADKIVIYKKNSEKRPTKINAEGKVVYEDGETVITSDFCDSDCDSNMDFVVTFSQNVILQGPDFGLIHADKAKYNTTTKAMDLTSKNKVKLILDKEIESDFNKKN